MELLIINLIGNPGAGKTSLAAHLATNQGYEVIRPSGIIAEYAKMNGLSLGDRQDYVDLHQRMRDDLGENVFSDIILESDAERICLDGLRVPNDVERLKKHGAVVVALWCPIKQRFERRAIELGLDVEDEVEFLKFKKEERIDYHSLDPSAPSTITVMGAAEHHIDASGPFTGVVRAIDLIAA